ncbi:MAG: HAD hydrolase family protein, partial [Ignavibacteriales bacterium]|nr:HAD hydrolase family protein [Ignavibacteriales bacterium]
MYYTEEGLVMKRYYVHDGMGASLLKKKGIMTGLISTDISPIGRIRGEKLNFDFIYTGLWDKPQALDEICEKTGFTCENIAFIGDDVNDIAILQKAGFSAAPANAMDSVKKIVDYICKRNGGKGAYREVAELLLEYSL